MTDLLTQARRIARKTGVSDGALVPPHKIFFAIHLNPDDSFSSVNIPSSLLPTLERDLKTTFGDLDRGLIANEYEYGYNEGRVARGVCLALPVYIPSRLNRHETCMEVNFTVRGTIEEIRQAMKTIYVRCFKAPHSNIPANSSVRCILPFLRQAGLGGPSSTLRLVDRAGGEHRV